MTRLSGKGASRSAVFAAVVATCCFMSGPADAALVTWIVDGTVPNVSDELNSLGLLDGAPTRYEVTYESSTAPVESLQSCCRWTFIDAVRAVSFTSGAFAVALPPGETSTFHYAYNTVAVDGPVRLEMIDSHLGSRSRPLRTSGR